MLNSGAGEKKYLLIYRAVAYSSLTFLGGTIHMGVTDDGRVHGLMMSADQMQHCLLSISNSLSQYFPPVPKCVRGC